MAYKPIRLIPSKTSFKFMNKLKLALVLSLVLSIGSIVLAMTKGLSAGIDFTGGIVIEARLPAAPDLANIRSTLSSKDLGDVSLQSIGTDNDILIRLPSQPGDEKAQQVAIDKVRDALSGITSGTVEYRKIDLVGPQVGEELVKNGIIAVALSFLMMIIYIWFRFEWQYGVGGILALVHDAVMTIGFYAVTGTEFNLTSIAALLTIVGYSINDSVVIYDRIRENIRKFKKMPMDELIDLSINETLSRTIMTTSTTLVAILALVLFGGEVIQGFCVAMLFGILVGTYSSIYISAPILIFLNLRASTQKTEAQKKESLA